MSKSHFPHVEFIRFAAGNARLGRPPLPPAQVRENQNNRAQHSAKLKQQSEKLGTQAKKVAAARKEEGLPDISGGVPFVLKIPDEDGTMIDFIGKKLGLEIVAEYDDGYLIVSTDDLELSKVLDLAEKFSTKISGSGQIARILDIETDRSSRNRISQILGEELFPHWPFPPDTDCLLDISVESASFNPPASPRKTPKSPEKYEGKLAEHEAELRQFAQDWDEERMRRESEIEALVSHYGGEILQITDDGAVEFCDSFSVRIRMSGRGFVDLVTNIPNLFEVSIPDHVENPLGGVNESGDASDSFTLAHPDESSPCICVIDSGMQEGHRWLDGAVDVTRSRCFIPNKPSDEVADYVPGGGHGTRVGGVCLYHDEIPKADLHQAPFWLQNARILDENNHLPVGLFPAKVLEQIVSFYLGETGTRLYQHSIAATRACRTSRMSIWACTIDRISHRRGVLFIQSAGNLVGRSAVNAPGIADHLENGTIYPNYLYESSSRIANPAQSLQALTVGSVSADYFENGSVQSISPSGRPSAFSRSGFGLWKSIKPEVVEIGGDYAKDTSSPPSLTFPPEVCPEMLRSTLDGGAAHARDAVGTSFSAPRISHISGHLAALFPDESPLLYRALIVNSARWPQWAEEADVSERPEITRSIGYGIPNLARASENSEDRITLITEGVCEAHAGEGCIFGIPIPASLRRPGEDHEVRIDVTLSYSAEPRRTRKSRRGYLSVWLDWVASKKEETFESFCARALKDFDREDTGSGNFAWTLGKKRTGDGQTPGVTRQNGTVQKDWAFARSFELPEVLGVAVHAHKGWCLDGSETAKFTVVASIEILGAGVEVYQEIKNAVEVEAGRVQTQNVLGSLF